MINSGLTQLKYNKWYGIFEGENSSYLILFNFRTSHSISTATFGIKIYNDSEAKENYLVGDFFIKPDAIHIPNDKMFRISPKDVFENVKKPEVFRKAFRFIFDPDKEN